MSGDYIKVKKGNLPGEYDLVLYFEQIGAGFNINLKEKDFIKLLHNSIRLVNNTSESFILQVPHDIQQILNDYEVVPLEVCIDEFRVYNKQQASKPIAEVTIYIPDQVVPIFSAEAITNATGDLMEALGFELETEDEPVFGSFFKKLRFAFSKTVGAEDLEEVYAKGKKAIELKYLDIPTAEQTEKLANAAEKLINSLCNVDEGVIRCGALLVLKKNVNGQPRLITTQLSNELITILDKSPQLLFDTKTVYQLVTGHVESAIGHEGEDEQIKIA